ncbi:MAG: hypothetical protein ACJAWL_000667 [Motiliproteus sp.]|jgi:hypothetical protein
MNRHSLRSISKSLIYKRQLKYLTATLTLGSLLWTVLGTPLWAAETDPVDPAPSATGSDPRILPDLEQERVQALANSHLPDTQTLWLETPRESFLGLFKPANVPVAKGAVLLLHHDRTSADWPGSISTLRRGLPDQGWHTLSIALPDAPEYIPPRTQDVILATFDNPGSTAAPSTPDTATPDTADLVKDRLEAHFEQISARIEAGLDYLGQQQPDRVLILGEGTGGYWALRYSIEQGEASTLFPILIDTLPPAGPSQPDLVELVSTLQRPTLDLYHGNGIGRHPVEVLAQQRRDASRRQGNGLLISSRIAPRAGDWHQLDRRLLGVVRGMLPRLYALGGKPEAPSPAQ